MFSLFLQEIWKVLVYSLILGAGLPVLYAVGVRASAYGTATAEGDADAATAGAAGPAGVRRRQVLGKTASVICFAIVLTGIGIGLAYIWASGHGDQLSFEHTYPTFVPKS